MSQTQSIERSPQAGETIASEPAPAKINLDLRIVDKRFDGYHELDSIVVFTQFGDRLDYRPADRFDLQIDGPFANDTPVENNIVLRAAEALAREFPDVRPLAFRLHKNLPVGSGIGGGSSDAAAAMRAIVNSSGLQIDAEGLRDIGATLGADIPVCLYANSARMRGTGLRLDPIRGLPQLPLVLVNPGTGVATEDVFAALDGKFSDNRTSHLQANASIVGFSLWLRDSHNDLEPVTQNLAPAIDEIKALIDEQDGALLARMSGSGATCFGIFSDMARADRAAHKIAAARPDWWVVATQTTD